MAPTPQETHRLALLLHRSHADGCRMTVSTVDGRLLSCRVYGWGNSMVTLDGQEIVSPASLDLSREERFTLRLEEIASVQRVPAVKPIERSAEGPGTNQ